MSQTENKVILITGAARGIGYALAKTLLKEKARLVLLVRQPKDEARLKKEFTPSSEHLIFEGDVSNENVAKTLVTETIKKFHRIDGLVNNAGILTPRSALHDVSVPDWDKTMAVNLRGPFLLSKYVIPHMIKQKQGCIINVSSGAGKRAAPFWGPYAVSKFGIEGLSLLMAEELREFGVDVVAFDPGGTRTAMRAQAYPQEDPQQLPHPDEIAKKIVNQYFS